MVNIAWLKINYFCFKLGINDYQRAERYLNEADWNEELAVQNFINKHRNILNNNFLFHFVFEVCFQHLFHLGEDSIVGYF